HSLPQMLGGPRVLYGKVLALVNCRQSLPPFNAEDRGRAEQYRRRGDQRHLRAALGGCASSGFRFRRPNPEGETLTRNRSRSLQAAAPRSGCTSGKPKRGGGSGRTSRTRSSDGLTVRFGAFSM